MLLELVGTAVETTLGAPIPDDTTMSFTLVSADGWPDGASGNPFPVTIGRGSVAEEKMLCSSRTGLVVVVEERGYDGTTAAAHAAGVEAIHSISAEMVAEVLAHANDDTNDVHTQYARKAQNLADLTNAGTARTNLGLGTAATHADSEYEDAGAAAAALVTALAAAAAAEADAIQRANHTGTQLSTTISDFEAAVEAIIGGGPVGSSGCVVKTADQTYTSDTTMNNDSVLKAALEANTEIAFRAFIVPITGSTPDFKFTFTVPAGASIAFHTTGDGGSALSVATGHVTASGTEVVVTATNWPTVGGSEVVLEVLGSVIVGGTAGDLQFQHAQNTSSGTATGVKAGSSLSWQVAA